LATTTNAWPDATNTGVPAGVTLTPSGDVIITQAGAVVSGLNITGSVYIRADNVTLENCKITSGGWAGVTIDSGVKGAVVQNCTIDGTGRAPDGTGNQGIMGSGTFIGNNIHGIQAPAHLAKTRQRRRAPSTSHLPSEVRALVFGGIDSATNVAEVLELIVERTALCDSAVEEPFRQG